MRIGLITPSNNHRYLQELNQNVEAARQTLKQQGIRLEWSIQGDGKPVPEDIQAEHTGFSSQQQGVSQARNQALAAVAEADWIYPIDADDLIDPQGLLELAGYAQAAEPQIGFIACNRQTLTGKSLPSSWAQEVKQIPLWQYGQDWCEKQATPHANSILYRPKAVQQAGGWPGLTQHEDVLLLARVNQSNPGLWIPASVTRYRLWEGQTIAQRQYAQNKHEICRAISQEINQARKAAGLPPVKERISRGGTQWKEASLTDVKQI